MLVSVCVQQFETPKYMVMAFELMEGGDLFRYLSSLPQSCMNEVGGRGGERRAFTTAITTTTNKRNQQ